MKASRAVHATLLAVIISAIMPCLARSQAAPSEPKFEVASIKPNRSGSRSFGIKTNPGGRLIAINETLPQLIDSAYALGEFRRTLAGESSRISGGPRWVYSERYDVNASAGREVTLDEMRSMLQALLVERFKLVVRRETRSRPTYALMIARPDGRLGAQLKRLDVDCGAVAAARAAAVRNGTPLPPPASNGAPLCGLSGPNDGVLKLGGVTTDVLAMHLSKEAGRTVVDKTGLHGNYEATLRFSPAATDGSSAPDHQPTIFIALREQLGLKLEPEQNPLQVLVIDRIERPTPN